MLKRIHTRNAELLLLLRLIIF